MAADGIGPALSPTDDNHVSESKPQGERPAKSKQEFSRRQWLLQLGEAAFVFGFSGSAADVEASAASALSLLAPEVKTLPPGLYDPSSEHMARALIRDERYVQIPSGSETDYVKPRQGPFQPRFFTPAEFAVVERLTQLMLGHSSGTSREISAEENQRISAEVAEWIDLVVSNATAVREAARRLAPEHKALAVRYYGADAVERLESADPQKTCREGLEWLDRESHQLHAGAFLSLEESQQLQILDAISDAALDPARESPGTRLFAFLKRETVRGFYTSRVGLKELDYKGNAFYVECPGCTGKTERATSARAIRKSRLISWVRPVG